MLDKTKFVKKTNQYSIAVTSGVNDTVILDIGARYEERLSRNLSAIHPDEISKRFDGVKELLWTRKYDGEGVLVFYDKDVECFAFSAPSGRARLGLPALDELSNKLKKAGIKKALFRGELYLPKKEKEHRPTVADVVRISFGTDEEEVATLRLALFDIVMLDGEDMRDDGESFLEEWDKLEEVVGTSGKDLVHRVEGARVAGKEIQKLFDREVDAGEEGLVVRLLDKPESYKIKPKQTVDCVVIGYVEGQVENAIGVTSLLMALNYPLTGKSKEWKLQSFARVGAGLNNELRFKLLEQLKALKVENPISMTDSDGRPIWFVKPELIIEMTGDDVVAENSDKKPYRGQVFSWDVKKAEYSYFGLAQCPKLIFPSISKVRGDKNMSSGGARIEQVIERPKAPKKKKSGGKKPVVILRRVFQKADAVRKLVVTERGADEESIPYVVYFTDFSAGRKDPLKVSTQYAMTHERKEALVEILLEKNIRKGWEEVS